VTAGHPIAYDAGRPVPVASFDFEAVARALDGEGAVRDGDERAIRLETMQRLLAFITCNGDARKVGRRALLLAYLVGASDCRSHAALAKRLRVSRPAVTQQLTKLRAAFQRLARGL
jgi:hypothetical protein